MTLFKIHEIYLITFKKEELTEDDKINRGLS